MGHGLEAFVEEPVELSPEEVQEQIIEDQEDEASLLDQITAENEAANATAGELSEALEELFVVAKHYAAVKEKGNVSLEDIQSIRMSIQNFPSMIDTPAEQLFPSLESNDPQIALEGVGDTIAAALGRIGNKIVNMIAIFSENLLTLGNLILKLINRTKAVMNQVKDIDTNESVEITFSASDVFFLYGNKTPIADFDTWVKELKKTVSFYQDAIQSIGRFTENDFARSVRTLFSPLSENKFKSDFVSVKRLVDGIIKNPAMKKTKSDRDADIYTSDGLLTGYSYIISRPMESLYNTDDYDSLRQYASKFNMKIHRTFPTLFGETVTMTVNKRQLEQAMEQLLLLEKSIQSFMTAKNAFGTITASTKNLFLLNLSVLPIHLLMLLFANFRMSLKLSNIIMRCNQGIFLVSRIMIIGGLSPIRRAAKKLNKLSD